MTAPRHGNQFANSSIGVLDATGDTDVQVVDANPDRIYLFLENDTGNTVYVAFGDSVSTSDYTMKLADGDTYESGNNCYSGDIAFMWGGASGTFAVTEGTP